MSVVVSVVTPVYNGQAHLAECIDSVLAQSFNDWEYIILDNASSDSTAQIIQRYREQDPRIKYHRNDATLPIIENWNTAMRHIDAASTYCKVVHADDILMPDCLQKMVAVAIKHPTVTLVGAYRIDGTRVNMDSIPYPTEFVSGAALAKDRFLGRIEDQFGSPSSVMYRADKVRQKTDFYDATNFHADTEVCIDLLRDGDYGFVHQALTYTRRHIGAESPAARKLGSHGVGRIITLQKFGHHFLTDVEYARALNMQLRYYYRFLARNPLRLREAEFRQYHIDFLRESELGFKLRMFSSALVRQCLLFLARKLGRILK
ncbi:MAG: glycosyltransferase family 2 protein [Pseudomonadales bacterium]